MVSSVDTNVVVMANHATDRSRGGAWLRDEGTEPECRSRQKASVTDRFTFRVAIVGLGYVGLPTMLSFHAAGHRVVGIDISERRLAVIRSQKADLLDSDRQRLSAALGDSRFVLSADLGTLALAESILICVPTPIDHHLLPDLSLLRTACQTVAENAVKGQTIIATSTTYVGCTREFLAAALEKRGMTVGRDIFVAFSPERIDPGNGHHAHEAVPRVVGGITPQCLSRATAALSEYSSILCPVSSVEAAEMTKLYENTFRAVNISLANEFADISSAMGIDVTEVIKAAATKPYGFMPFYPGPGVGGHCIPCDPHYLLWQLRSKRMVAPLIESAMISVATRPRQVVRRASEVLGSDGHPLAGANVLIVGVAYKAGIADVRESPALEIMAGLLGARALVSFTDPYIPSVTMEDASLFSVADPQRENWDLVIVHTVHPGIDLAWLGEQRMVLDTTYHLTGVPHRHTL